MSLKEVKTIGGPNRDPLYQQKWRRALNAAIRLLMRRAHEGGVLASEIKEILEAELHLTPVIVMDALHYLERQELVSVEPFDGELVAGERYALNAAGITAIATSSDPYITIRVTDG